LYPEYQKLGLSEERCPSVVGSRARSLRRGVRCDARRERVMDIRYMNDVQFHGTIVT